MPLNPAEITVVTGLPRSGTSMLMAMLAAGGAPLWVDGQRPPDPDNPNGYWEYEKVKRLKDEADWLVEAAGHAVKIVSPLLIHLPKGPEYRVLFIERNLAEVMASQKAMMDRLGTGDAQGDDDLTRAFGRLTATVKDFLTRRAIPTLFLQHHNILTDPHDTANRINRFLGGRLNPKAMAEAVVPALYRQRNLGPGRPEKA